MIIVAYRLPEQAVLGSLPGQMPRCCHTGLTGSLGCGCAREKCILRACCHAVTLRLKPVYQAEMPKSKYAEVHVELSILVGQLLLAHLRTETVPWALTSELRFSDLQGTAFLRWQVAKCVAGFIYLARQASEGCIAAVEHLRKLLLGVSSRNHAAYPVMNHVKLHCRRYQDIEIESLASTILQAAWLFDLRLPCRRASTRARSCAHADKRHL